MKRLITVVAARNEADNISEVIAKSRRYGDVIVVDNASSDGTVTIAERAGAVVLRHECDTHIRQSYVDGFRLALSRGAQEIIQMNAGLSFDPDQVPLLLDGLEMADMVIGSRFIAGSRCVQPYKRRFLSRSGSALIRLATGMPFLDLTGSFKAFRASLLQALDDEGILRNLKARAHAFQFELTYEIYMRGFAITETPISYFYTSKRTSADFSTILEALWTVARLLRRRLTIYALPARH